jgi:hypothetical protein
MKKVLLAELLLFVCLLAGNRLFAQDNCDLAIEQFSFTASSPKEVTQNIKEILVYSKSIDAEFNQRAKGNLFFLSGDNTSIVCVDTKFDGEVHMEGSDYSSISDFLGVDFKKKQDYYFIPQHDAPAWFECKTSGKVWIDLNVTKSDKGNVFVYKIYVPSKTLEGKPYEPEYQISSVTLNDKSAPFTGGKKNYGTIKNSVLFVDTIRSDNSLIRVEIKIKGLGKAFKLMYLDRTKGDDYTKDPIKGLQFYNLPAKAISQDSTIYSFQRVGVYTLKPGEKYQASIVLIFSNGKECPLQKKDKFMIQPIIQEYKTGKIDTLAKRTLTNRRGSLIYRYLYDIPEGTSSVQFNYGAIINCNNGGNDNRGHINACSVFIYNEE